MFLLYLNSNQLEINISNNTVLSNNKKINVGNISKTGQFKVK
jgi:hypothetical protein